VAEPVYGEEKLVVVELDLTMCRAEQMTLDVTGHYSRSDALELVIHSDSGRVVQD
jgi:hypothetical protein